MRSSRESGSIISFIVIGVVLIGLLLGGLYVSKQRARSVVNGDSTPTKVATSDEKANDKSNETTRQEAKPTTGSSNTQTTPAQGSNDTSNSTATPRTSTPATQVPSTGPSSIASTGPEDSIVVRAIILLAIGLSIASYRVSRRELLTTALR